MIIKCMDGSKFYVHIEIETKYSFKWFICLHVDDLLEVNKRTLAFILDQKNL